MEEHDTFLRDRCVEAIAMIDAFASVGVERFDVIHTDVDQQLRGYRPNQTVRDVRKSIPYLVPGSFRRRNNLIIRPRPPANGAMLAQLDDLDLTKMQRVQPVAFLVLRTSDDSYQAWVAIRDGTKERVRELVRNAGADPRASGAVRLAGTKNYKHKYEPDFPLVDAFGIQELSMPVEPLAKLGLMDIPEPPWAPAPHRMQPPKHYQGPRRWPDYVQALSGASLKPDGGRDRSQADFTWCMWAIDRGWSVDETAAELEVRSDKAKESLERGYKGYTRLTAWKASLAVARNRGEIS
jgi:hypothetical protein